MTWTRSGGEAVHVARKPRPRWTGSRRSTGGGGPTWRDVAAPRSPEVGDPREAPVSPRSYPQHTDRASRKRRTASVLHLDLRDPGDRHHRRRHRPTRAQEVAGGSW